MAQKIAQKELKPDYVVDQENKLAVTQFVAYFTGDVDTMRQQGIDPRKGICLVGNPGSGKSMLFRIIKACLNHDEFRPYFQYFTLFNAEHPGKLYMQDGEASLTKFIKPTIKSIAGTDIENIICFDDLGAEEIKNLYGNKKEVMADIIQQRYDNMLQTGLRTHFTTNETPDGIEQRYSTRVRSRIRHMCNTIVLGENKDYTDRR